MKGIEILNQYEVVIETTLNTTAFWIVFGIIATIMIGLGITFYISGECSMGIIPALTVLGLVAGLMFGSLFGTMTQIPIKYETHYEVQISEDVSMLEFIEKYEIVDQQGNIFTIREKTE